MDWLRLRVRRLSSLTSLRGNTDRDVLQRVNVHLALVCRIIALWSMTYGILITVQGDPAWSLHAYDILQKVPGVPFVFGITLAVSGLGLFVFETYRPRIAGLFAIVIALIVFAIAAGFLLADLFVEGVAPTGQPGVVTYGLLVGPLVLVRAISLLRDGV